MLNASQHYDRDSLLGAHEAADDCADWAVNQYRKESAEQGAIYRAEQEREAERIRLIFESAERIDHCAWCNPQSCMWPKCSEMAATAGGPPSVPTRRNRRAQPVSWWARFFAWLP